MLECGASPFRSQPGERPDYVSLSTAAQHELPGRRAAQSNFLASEGQRSARPGSQILWSDRQLRRQTERIGRHGAAAGDLFATRCRKRLDRLVGRRCRVAEAALDRQHIETAVHAQQFTAASKARQGLLIAARLPMWSNPLAVNGTASGKSRAWRRIDSVSRSERDTSNLSEIISISDIGQMDRRGLTLVMANGCDGGVRVCPRSRGALRRSTRRRDD